MLGRLKTAFVAISLLGSVMVLDVPVASAHGNCQLYGGYEMYPSGSGPYDIYGSASTHCPNATHTKSSAFIKLQIYYNSRWYTRAQSANPNSQCCNQKTYVVFTSRGACQPGFGIYQWRVWVEYFNLLNPNNTVAHHWEGLARSWTMDCVNIP